MAAGVGAAGGEQHEGVEHLVVEPGRARAGRRGAARPLGPGGRGARGRARAWRSRWAEREGNVAGLVVAGEVGDPAGHRVGCVAFEEAEQRQEACPRPSPTAGRWRWRSRARRAASAARPARRRVDRASGRRVTWRRRVNTSMWRASSATVMARTCWISRKWGWTWPRKRAGTTSAASSFSMRNVITCTTASSTGPSWSIGAVQSMARRRVPLGGGRLGVQGAGAIGPHLVAVVEAEARRRAARLDGGAAGGQAPRAGGRSTTAPPSAGSTRAGALGADPAGAGGRAPLDEPTTPSPCAASAGASDGPAGGTTWRAGRRAPDGVPRTATSSPRGEVGEGQLRRARARRRRSPRSAEVDDRGVGGHGG